MKVLVACLLSLLVLGVVAERNGNKPGFSTNAKKGNGDRRSCPSQTTNPVVNIESGPIRGVIIDNSTVFLGIPFAAPPTGTNRFQPPRPVTPWTAVRDVNAVPNFCKQPVPWATSEDCLYLNVYLPDTTISPGRDLPVLFYIHGGSFIFGSASERDYWGQNMATKGGVMVVVANYRLGVFGFSVFPSTNPADPRPLYTNNGILDQQAALKWVQRNIRKFGGNPSQVTLFGESAGGISTCIHYTLPTSAGLFHRGIISSGTCVVGTKGPFVNTLNANFGFYYTYLTAKNLNCAASLSPPSIDFACVQGKSEDALNVAAVVEGAFISWFPVVDYRIILADPRYVFITGKQQPLPLLIGSNTNEGNWFMPFPYPLDYVTYASTIIGASPSGTVSDPIANAALARYDPFNPNPALWKNLVNDPTYDVNYAFGQLVGDWYFTCGTRSLMRLHSKKAPVYQYVFNHTFSALAQTCAQNMSFNGYCFMGIPHALEIPFVWGNLGESAFGLSFSADEVKLADELISYWTSFAKNAVPKGTSDDAVRWPKYNFPTYRHLLINDGFSIQQSGNYPSDNSCDWWESLYAYEDPTALTGSSKGKKEKSEEITPEAAGGLGAAVTFAAFVAIGAAFFVKRHRANKGAAQTEGSVEIVAERESSMTRGPSESMVEPSKLELQGVTGMYSSMNETNQSSSAWNLPEVPAQN